QSPPGRVHRADRPLHVAAPLAASGTFLSGAGAFHDDPHRSRGWDVPARLEVERRLGERDDVELIGDLLSFSEGGIAATHGVSFSRIDRRRWSGSVLLERADEFDGDAAVMVQVVGERLEPQLPVLIDEREHAFAAGAALE